MNKKVILLSITSVILIFCLAVAACYYYFLKDINHYYKQVLKPLEDKSGCTITIGEIEWRLFFGIEAAVKNLRIVHRTTNAVLLNADKIYVHFALFPLLRRELVVSHIIMDRPQLHLARSQDGTWLGLPAHAFDSTLHSSTAVTFYTLSVILNKFVVRNGTMHLNDEQYAVVDDFVDVDLSLSRSPFSRSIHISFSAQQKSYEKPGIIAVNGTVTHYGLTSWLDGLEGHGTLSLDNVSLPQFIPYVYRWIPIGRCDGKLDAQIECSAALPNMVSASGWFKSDSLTWTTQSQVRVPVPQFLFKVDGKLEQDTLTIKNSELAVPGITASGSFSVSHISHESPEAYGRFSTNTFEWETLKKHIPETIIKTYFPDFVNRISSGSLIFKSIELKSTLHTPVQTIFNSLTGTGELHNLHVAINNTLPVLKLNNCTFSFSKGDIIFDHARVQCYPDDTHELTGKISNVLQNPLLDLSSSSKIPAAAVTYFLSGLLKNTNSKVNDATTFFAGSGMLTSSTVLNIPLTAGQLAKFSSTIDLTQADYTISTAVAKPAGVPNQATFSGTFVTGKIPEAINFNVHLNRNCVQFTGILSNWSSPILDLTYSLSNADISVLKYPILHPDTSIRAILSGEGVIKIPLLQPAGIAITGSLLANGFEIKKASDPTPLLNFSIAAAIRGQTLTFNTVSGSFGKSSLTGSGTMHGWDTTPQGNFKADVLSLDLDDFIETVISLKKLNMVQIKLTAAAPQSLSQPQSTEKTFFRRALFYVDATVQKGKFLSWQFTDGTTQVSIKDGLLNFDDITIYGYRGTVKGLVSLDFAQTDLYTLRIVPSASVIEFNEFLPELKQGIVLSGTMDLDGTFSSTYTHGYEVVPRMHGGFRVHMKNMKFGKFTFVSKIFSLVNFSEIIKLHAPDIFSTGMPFDTVVGSFVMEKGIAHTDDVFFKGPAMNLSTVGDINFSKKEIDFVVGVQPLETIAKLLGEIPIAGSIITGENKTLTLSYFNVKGPYIDPSVKPMPVESLSQGVKTIFKRIFKLPRELLNSGKKKEDHSSKNIQETTK